MHPYTPQYVGVSALELFKYIVVSSSAMPLHPIRTKLVLTAISTRPRWTTATRITYTTITFLIYSPHVQYFKYSPSCCSLSLACVLVIKFDLLHPKHSTVGARDHWIELRAFFPDWILQPELKTHLVSPNPRPFVLVYPLLFFHSFTFSFRCTRLPKYLVTPMLVVGSSDRHPNRAHHWIYKQSK